MGSAKGVNAGTPPLGQAEFSGLKDQALSPEQKRAVEALAALAAHREKAKDARRDLKEEDGKLELAALEALDGVELQLGKLGHVAFEARLTRRLKVKLLRSKTRKEPAGKKASAGRKAAGA